MSSVICFGEALIDFLNVARFNTDIQENSSLMLSDYRQYPGGAPANAAVAVAKLGGNAYFAGQVGQDAFGDFLEQALKHYQVDTRFLLKHASAKTALAFVSLDETGERSFAFYRDNSADVLLTKNQVQQLLFTADKLEPAYIFHFCSNTLTSADIAQTTLYAVKQALQQQALISFDVNLRHNLWSTGKADIALVNQLVAQAHVLKFSKEELDYLSHGQQGQYISDCLSQQASLLVVTDGGNDINYYTAHSSGTIKPPTIKVVDTTAGGDGFVGGLLYGLSQLDLTLRVLVELIADESRLEGILHFACACGAYAVSKQGAFPALPNFNQVSDLLTTQPKEYGDPRNIFSKSTI